MRRMMVVSCVVTLLLTGSAFADWDPGDDFKMHYPQLPDPQGWDVDFTDSGFAEPHVLADDWQCIETGWVSDIHFWLSSRQDMPFDILNVHASIHSDDVSGAFSKPGDLLWQADFDPAMFTIRHYGSGLQGWYDPGPLGTVVPGDHTMIHQVNIMDIADPFLQQEGTVYWLDLSVLGFGPVGPAQLGWKTSIDHFRDDAVWLNFGGMTNHAGLAGDIVVLAPGWQPLTDPFTGETLDLAFVITGEPIPEPAGLGLIGLSLLAVRRRRR